MSRYKVTTNPIDASKWVILDKFMWGYCALPDDDSAHPNLLPLEWDSPVAANDWLMRCFRSWAKGKVPAPDGWRPDKDEVVLALRDWRN